jgi:ribosome biogenesis protein Tsr3
MKIIANVDYVVGHLRYGHYELELNDEEYKEYKSLSEEDKISWIEDGKFIIDDYEVDDIGTITEIREYND